MSVNILGLEPLVNFGLTSSGLLGLDSLFVEDLEVPLIRSSILGKKPSDFFSGLGSTFFTSLCCGRTDGLTFTSLSPTGLGFTFDTSLV